MRLNNLMMRPLYFFIKIGDEKMISKNENAQAINSVEDMPAVAQDIIKKYCEDNGFDERDIYPSVWNDILSELYFNLFKPCNKLLKINNARGNEYDRLKVFYVYEYIYKRICNKHCQEISLKGFCDMTGIHKQSIYNWADDNKYIYNNNGIQLNDGGDLSAVNFDLHEKIMSDNEESLFSLMKDRRYNPMKLLPKLNKVHGWNMPGTGRQREKPVAQDEKLPQFYETSAICTKQNDDSLSVKIV